MADYNIEIDIPNLDEINSIKKEAEDIILNINMNIKNAFKGTSTTKSEAEQQTKEANKSVGGEIAGLGKMLGLIYGALKVFDVIIKPIMILISGAIGFLLYQVIKYLVPFFQDPYKFLLKLAITIVNGIIGGINLIIRGINFLTGLLTIVGNGIISGLNAIIDFFGGNKIDLIPEDALSIKELPMIDSEAIEQSYDIWKQTTQDLAEKGIENNMSFEEFLRASGGMFETNMDTATEVSNQLKTDLGYFDNVSNSLINACFETGKSFDNISTTGKQAVDSIEKNLTNVANHFDKLAKDLTGKSSGGVDLMSDVFGIETKSPYASYRPDDTDYGIKPINYTDTPIYNHPVKPKNKSYKDLEEEDRNLWDIVVDTFTGWF